MLQYQLQANRQANRHSTHKDRLCPRTHQYNSLPHHDRTQVWIISQTPKLALWRFEALKLPRHSATFPHALGYTYPRSGCAAARPSNEDGQAHSNHSSPSRHTKRPSSAPVFSTAWPSHLICARHACCICRHTKRPPDTQATMHYRVK